MSMNLCSFAHIQPSGQPVTLAVKGPQLTWQRVTPQWPDWVDKEMMMCAYVSILKHGCEDMKIISIFGDIAYYMLESQSRLCIIKHVGFEH